MAAWTHINWSYRRQFISKFLFLAENNFYTFFVFVQWHTKFSSIDTVCTTTNIHQSRLLHCVHYEQPVHGQNAYIIFSVSKLRLRLSARTKQSEGNYGHPPPPKKVPLNKSQQHFTPSCWVTCSFDAKNQVSKTSITLASRTILFCTGKKMDLDATHSCSRAAKPNSGLIWLHKCSLTVWQPFVEAGSVSTEWHFSLESGQVWQPEYWN